MAGSMGGSSFGWKMAPPSHEDPNSVQAGMLQVLSGGRDLVVDDDDEPRKRKRKRVLACPICKLLRNDGSMVQDGQKCNGGHMKIDNDKKIVDLLEVWPVPFDQWFVGEHCEAPLQ